ncbi:hypothetical protein JOB18_033050 [Solea senegalensis]|uniref:SH2 domain-containing protein n=2 Tax=Solea senegalensis TaxID=28829 RepID=A0AAV6SFE8_SOLSE|nr:ras and Rab interactor 3-like [Solea senegalensis]KAG7516506.1 hypothetical protein JOB18_033050 [Solea senegalensis]
MAQQEEPLYDFPEPTKSSHQKLLGLQRGRGSLRSISVLDRLLLTGPVWLQLSINPATALHILQREPPGTFLVRKSRTSQRNVLCIRLTDDSVPSFVQQFGIREELSTLTLETSAISFPDLPRLISFYCVSRDVLPFPLELPEAIAKATSHKELESISHMGIEFWSSHLNVRGPREAPKSQIDKEKKPDAVTPATPAAAAPTTSSDSAPQPNSDHQLTTEPESDTNGQQLGSKPTLFHEFCPITTRSPRELDCGSGLGALCFINPLFLQSQTVLSRRNLLKRSLKIRVSTETLTPLSPPLAPPPPPPLKPKTKGKCKAQKQGQGDAKPSKVLIPLQDGNQATAPDTQTSIQRQEDPDEAQIQPPSAAPQDQVQEQVQGQVDLEEAAVTLPKIMEHHPEESEYMQPSPGINSSLPRSLSPYLSPAVAPLAPPPNPTGFIPISPGALASLSPYQSPSVSPRPPFSLSPHDSPCASPSLSPYQSPSVSPKVPFSLSPRASPSPSPYQSPSVSPKLPVFMSPFTSSPPPQLAEQVYDTPALPLKANQRSQRDAEEEEEGGTAGAKQDEDCETNAKGEEEEEEQRLVLKMKGTSLNDTDSSSSFSSLEGAAETPPPSPHDMTVPK